MKKSTLIFSLAALAATFCGIDNASAQTTEADAPKQGNVVISKFYYSRSKNKADNKNYMPGQFIEIYNNSAKPVNCKGLYLGIVEADSKTLAWTPERLNEAGHKDSILIRGAFQIPTDKDYILEPGKSYLLVNSAIDHSSASDFECDLTGADFEAKTTNASYPHSDAVTALTMAYTYIANIDYMLLGQAGPCPLVLFTTTEDLDKLPTVYQYGKTTGNTNKLMPKSWVIDAFEVISSTQGENGAWKRFTADLDEGYTSAKGYVGERFYRRTRSVEEDGRIVLWDTNNSSVDFATSTTIQPREYDKTAETLKLSVTIPESGHLALRPGANFSLPENMFATSINATAKSTELKYTSLTSEDGIISSDYKNKSCFILTAEPGTYEITLTNEPQTKNHISSTVLSWLDVAPGQAFMKNRVLYKFVNTAEKVGFERDEKYFEIQTVSGQEMPYSMYCDMEEGQHAYIPLAANALKSIATAGETTPTDLKFFPWNGPKPGDKTAITNIVAPVSSAIYDLQGRKHTGALKAGLYIQNGKKFIVR